MSQKNIDIHITVTYSGEHKIPHKLLEHKVKWVPEIVMIETSDKNMFVQSILEKDKITEEKILWMIPIWSTQRWVSRYVSDQEHTTTERITKWISKKIKVWSQKWKILNKMKIKPLDWYQAENFMNKTIRNRNTFVWFEAWARLSELYKDWFLDSEKVEWTNRKQYKLSLLFIESEQYKCL